MTEAEATITGSDRSGPGGTRPVDALLAYQKAGFYGCLPVPDVSWERNGDAPPPGYVQYPTVGPVLYTPGTGGPCTYHGFLITAPMKVTIDSRGWFAGVADGPTASWIQVTLLASGRVLDTFYAEDPAPGWHYWGGWVTFFLEDVVLGAGEELYQECIFGDWAGFEYYSEIPGDTYWQSHFRITGETLPGKPFLRGHAVVAAIT